MLSPVAHGQIQSAPLSRYPHIGPAKSQIVPSQKKSRLIPPTKPKEKVPKKAGRPRNETREQYAPPPRPGNLWSNGQSAASGSGSSARGKGRGTSSLYPSPSNIPDVSQFETRPQIHNPLSAARIEARGSGSGTAAPVPRSTPGTEGSHGSCSRLPSISSILYPFELPNPLRTSAGHLVSDTLASEAKGKNEMEGAAAVYSVGGRPPPTLTSAVRNSMSVKMSAAKTLLSMARGGSEPEPSYPITAGYPMQSVNKQDKYREEEQVPRKMENRGSKGNKKRGRPQESTSPAGEDAGRSAKRRQSDREVEVVHVRNTTM
ncbi:hypothetical protein B0T20DRAFT_395240 [Sordaria brevicollis]|uniref:Uncharacterized protein n=1 Tax=Sordaria brevicollis TaxID=83679 RepID=A0AAE0U8X3_SORBR|nr:hypothetical protein B0T20DRAFT_395240 [Sordaria brevicollis]